MKKQPRGQLQRKTPEEQMKEVRAFYEGDIVAMDNFQTETEDSDQKTIDWYDVDMVLVIPNPDHPKYAHHEMHLDDVDEAVERYKK